MDDSEFDEFEDGVIDHDLLYDLDLENNYDDDPLAPHFDALNPVNFHDFLDHFGSDSLNFDIETGLDREVSEQYGHGIQHDISSSLDSSAASGPESQSSGDDQYLQAPVSESVDSEANSEPDSESVDEYPDEGFEEAIEGLHYPDPYIPPDDEARQAAHLEEYDREIEQEFDAEDEFDEGDHFGDRIPLSFSSDSLESASSSAYSSSVAPSPPAPHNDGYLLHELQLDLIRQEQRRLEQELHILEEEDVGQFHDAPLPYGVAWPGFPRYAAPQPALPNRLAQEEAQHYLAQVEMEAEHARNRERRERNRVVERFGPEAMQPVNRNRRRTAAEAFNPPPRPQQTQAPLFIDLTDEPDSPPREIIALPNAPRFTAQPAGGRDRQPGPNHINPRRQAGIRRTPSLARSDGSLLGHGPGPGGPLVIDLTEDAPEVQPAPPRRIAPIMPPPAGWRAMVQPPNMDAVFRHMTRQVHNLANRDFLQSMQIAWGGSGQQEFEVQIIAENPRARDGPLTRVDEILAHLPNNPLANNPPGHLNYGGNGFGREAPRDKPVHIAPPEPRDGFTRATGEDMVVTCPSCDEELRYDPDDPDEPPSKKARTRKEREEHHFWAVKSCGHVYCRSCFENRMKKSRVGMAFKRPTEKKVVCAVDECDTEITAKAAWVGIFL